LTIAIPRPAADFAQVNARSPVRKLRLLQAAQSGLPRKQHAPTKPKSPHAKREAWLLVLLALGLHALVGFSIWNRSNEPRKPKFSQEMELIRPQPEIKPEPPKPPPPPPKKIEPPKAVEPPKPTPLPPAALRTAPAEAPQANTLTVPENLTAAKTTGPVVAAPPPPPPAPAKVEEPITEANGSAAYLNNPPPAYPKAAQRLGMQGRVLLRVQVLANGSVGALEVKQSSGKPVLDEAALAAVKNWIFTPAKRGSTPIDGWTQVPIEFRLAQ
jgi:protein TonB